MGLITSAVFFIIGTVLGYYVKESQYCKEKHLLNSKKKDEEDISSSKEITEQSVD